MNATQWQKGEVRIVSDGFGGRQWFYCPGCGDYELLSPLLDADRTRMESRRFGKKHAKCKRGKSER
jgi:hypothetical protein